MMGSGFFNAVHSQNPCVVRNICFTGIGLKVTRNLTWRPALSLRITRLEHIYKHNVMAAVSTTHLFS